MKSLGYTIDRIVKAAPHLEEDLLRIRRKWKKYPKREMLYWKEMLNLLNSSELKNHPNWTKIRSIIIPNRKKTKEKNTFRPISPNDKEIGVLPGNLADKARRYDRAIIALEKKRFEAHLTNDTEAIAQIYRRHAIQEIRIKNIWVEVKDHFNLWNMNPNQNLIIKKKGLLLVVVLDQPKSSPPPQQPQQPTEGMIGLDVEVLRKFLRSLGMDLPPGLFPES